MITNHLLINKLALKYDTNRDLVKSLSTWFGVTETENMLKMKPSNLQKTIRVNITKISRTEMIDKLADDNIKCSPLTGVPEGILVKSGWKKIGSHISYLNGEFMPQGYGSMLAVHALDPLPGETILEMAAAPGGKSCFIGERLQGKGILIANDRSIKRISALIGNLARHEIENVIVTLQDGMNLEIQSVDRILLDAPCTGEGLIVSKINRRKSKIIHENYKMQKVQIGLLNKAINLLKPGGTCVYSTCSLTPIENEQVIEKVLNKVTIEKLQVEGQEGFSSIHPEFIKTKRLLPSVHMCDGFFIAKLVKVEPQ